MATFKYVQIDEEHLASDGEDVGAAVGWTRSLAGVEAHPPAPLHPPLEEEEAGGCQQGGHPTL